MALLAVPESSRMEPTAAAEPTPPKPQVKECQYHKPPPGVDYAENPSVFGRILRGESPALTLYESQELLAFQDRSPKAKLHALVIPKRYISTVSSLTKGDLHTLQDMRAAGLELIEKYQPQAFQRDDYILCYHVPPFNSVDHLHLHVLAPASEMSVMYRFGKYRVGTMWCADEALVRHRLEMGRKA